MCSGAVADATWRLRSITADLQLQHAENLPSVIATLRMGNALAKPGVAARSNQQLGRHRTSAACAEAGVHACPKSRRSIGLAGLSVVRHRQHCSQGWALSNRTRGTFQNSAQREGSEQVGHELYLEVAPGLEVRHDGGGGGAHVAQVPADVRQPVRRETTMFVCRSPNHSQ